MSQNESNNEREESSDNEQDESSDNEREESSQSTCNFKGRHKSFVWDYFEKDNNGITSTCKIILDDGKECGVSYNDGSTTSNLINHLARRHWIFKNTPCRPSNAIKGQFIRTENEYELIRQDLISFIIDDSQPFNIVECKSFRKLLHSLDENFSIPCDKTVKTTVSQSFSWSKLQLINMIENDSIAVSMTMDFWTSRRHHGYVGITCAWISESWKPKEALLILQRVLYPHTGEIIADLLNHILIEWDLIDKMIAITTDNGSNIKKAVQLLGFSRIPCAAHVLQLTVGKGLNVVKHLVLRAKRLIDFFNNSPKQTEYLLTAQKDLGFKKRLSTIGDISTRWNSTFYAWERLIQLKRAIVYLPSRFQSDESASVRKDGERLARIMLSDDEWIFLDELNDILCGFEEVTTLLSGNSYVTISLMYPAISVLVKTLKSSLQQFYIETVSTDMSELTILDYMEEIIDDTKDFIEIKEVDLTSEIIHKKIDISVSMITIGMLEKVKKIFYDSMYKYWQSVTDVGMLACLLDPRFKKLRFASANIIQKTNDHLKKLYESECEVYMASNHSTPLSNIQNEDLDTSMLPRKRKSILSELYADNNNTINEIDEYLLLEEERRRTNPFQWWSLKKTQFPILSKIARKYLCVSATSVSSERLFSDVGNNITAKRTNLDPELV